MPTDGETAPRLGEEFRLRACTLAKSLGYTERVGRRFGIDFGADPPSRKRNLTRPLFSPNGRTAFDFKSGIRVQIVGEADKLRRKIEQLNGANNPEFSNIAGGVIVTDNKVGGTDISRALELGVNCWDIRYAHFLAKKVGIFSAALRLNRNSKERQLDDWTTWIVNFGSYEGFMELEANLFYHDPMHEMNAQKVETILQRFTNATRSMTHNLNITVIIHVRLHSIAEVTEGAEDRFKELISHQVDEYLRYEPQACFVQSYSIAPWHIYCRESA
jgi:hypothetical protein